MPETNLLEPYFRAVVRNVNKAINNSLAEFQQSLQTWLNDFLNRPIPEDWRAELDRFAAETYQRGQQIEPDGMANLARIIEARIARQQQQTRVRQAAENLADKHKAEQTGKPESRFPVGPTKRVTYAPTSTPRPTAPFIQRQRFDQFLAAANHEIAIIEGILAALGQRLDAAPGRESVDVDAEVDAVEQAIYRYNALLEQARAVWLSQTLSDEAINRINESVRTPAALGLPMFVDPEQYRRAFHQGVLIGERQGRRNQAMDRLVLGMQVAEVAGTAASLATGGVLVYQAAKTGGKWAVIKLAASAAAGLAVEQATEFGLRTVGAGEETIHGARLAAAVIAYILARRQVRASGRDGTRSAKASGEGEFGRQPTTSRQPNSHHAHQAPSEAASEGSASLGLAGEVPPGTGRYTAKIKWGIHEVDARPSGPGFWGKRIRQADPRVEAFELKINPNGESYFLPHPDGGFVQFENLSAAALQDGKLIMQPRSLYHVNDMPAFARDKIIAEAQRQLAAASQAGLQVEWLVSDRKASIQLAALFQRMNLPISIRTFAE